MSPADASPVPQLFGFVLIDVEQIAAAYNQQAERAEMIRAIAAGQPACFVYARQRQRKVT